MIRISDTSYLTLVHLFKVILYGEQPRNKLLLPLPFSFTTTFSYHVLSNCNRKRRLLIQRNKEKANRSRRTGLPISISAYTHVFNMHKKHIIEIHGILANGAGDFRKHKHKLNININPRLQR